MGTALFDDKQWDAVRASHRAWWRRMRLADAGVRPSIRAQTSPGKGERG